MEGRSHVKLPKSGKKQYQQEKTAKFTLLPFDRPNLLWAAVLILSGAVFLMNNFGLLPWSLWGFLWRFWPLFLVFGGLQVVFGSTPYRRVLLIQTGLILLLFIFLLGLSLQVSSFKNWFADQFSGVQLENINRYADVAQTKEITLGENRLQKVTSRKINLNLPGGEMKVVDSANSYYLKLDSSFYKGLGEPNVSSDLRQGILNINFDTDPNVRLPLGPLNQIKYDFDLGEPIVNSDLAIKVGAGRATVELERMTLNKFVLNMGAGTADVVIKGNAVPTGGMNVRVGAGSVYIQIPSDVTVKITHNVGMGTLWFNQTNVSGKGVLQPANFSSSGRSLEMNVEVGAGVVNIETD